MNMKCKYLWRCTALTTDCCGGSPLFFLYKYEHQGDEPLWILYLVGIDLECPKLGLAPPYPTYRQPKAACPNLGNGGPQGTGHYPGEGRSIVDPPSGWIRSIRSRRRRNRRSRSNRRKNGKGGGGRRRGMRRSRRRKRRRSSRRRGNVNGTQENG